MSSHKLNITIRLTLILISSMSFSTVSSTPLRAGVPDTLPGFSVFKGELLGDIAYFMDIIQCFENQQNQKTNWVSLPTARLLQSLKENELDSN